MLTITYVIEIEMRCLRRLLIIAYRYIITNIEVRNRVTKEISPHSELLAMVIAKKMRWFGHVIRSNIMSKQFFVVLLKVKEDELGQKCNGKTIS